MKTIRALQIFILLFASASTTMAQPSLHSRAFDIQKSSEILVEVISRIDEQSFSLGSALHAWISRSQTEAALCSGTIDHDQQIGLMCVRHDLIQTIHYARKSNLIDEIEASNLKTILGRLTLRDQQITFLPLRSNPWIRYHQKRQRKIMIPSLSNYSTKVNFFERRRSGLGQPSQLDPETLELLKKLYRRKVFGLGHVTPDQYLVAKYSIAQINMMSGLIAEVIQWTDQRVTGEIILDRVGLSEKKRRLSELKKQFAYDSSNGLNSVEISQKRSEIESLEKQIALIDTDRKLDELNEQRYQSAIKLADIEGGANAGQSRETLQREIQDLSDQIDVLQDTLENEKISIQLDPMDLHRLAMNHLENQIETRKREKNGLLSSFSGELADLLVAAYLTGDVDGSLLKSLLKVSDFQEHHPSTLLQAGKILWVAGRMYLMVNPYTVVPTTLVSVTVSAIQKKKEYERQLSKKTFLIRQ